VRKYRPAAEVRGFTRFRQLSHRSFSSRWSSGSYQRWNRPINSRHSSIERWYGRKWRCV